MFYNYPREKRSYLESYFASNWNDDNKNMNNSNNNDNIITIIIITIIINTLILIVLVVHSISLFFVYKNGLIHNVNICDYLRIDEFHVQ